MPAASNFHYTHSIDELMSRLAYRMVPVERVREPKNVLELNWANPYDLNSNWKLLDAITQHKLLHIHSADLDGIRAKWSSEGENNSYGNILLLASATSSGTSGWNKTDVIECTLKFDGLNSARRCTNGSLCPKCAGIEKYRHIFSLAWLWDEYESSHDFYHLTLSPFDSIPMPVGFGKEDRKEFFRIHNSMRKDIKNMMRSDGIVGYHYGEEFIIGKYAHQTVYPHSHTMIVMPKGVAVPENRLSKLSEKWIVDIRKIETFDYFTNVLGYTFKPIDLWRPYVEEWQSGPQAVNKGFQNFVDTFKPLMWKHRTLSMSPQFFKRKNPDPELIKRIARFNPAVRRYRKRKAFLDERNSLKKASMNPTIRQNTMTISEDFKQGVLASVKEAGMSESLGAGILHELSQAPITQEQLSAKLAEADPVNQVKTFLKEAGCSEEEVARINSLEDLDKIAYEDAKQYQEGFKQAALEGGYTEQFVQGVMKEASEMLEKQAIPFVAPLSRMLAKGMRGAGATQAAERMLSRGQQLGPGAGRYMMGRAMNAIHPSGSMGNELMQSASDAWLKNRGVNQALQNRWAVEDIGKNNWRNATSWGQAWDRHLNEFKTNPNAKTQEALKAHYDAGMSNPAIKPHIEQMGPFENILSNPNGAHQVGPAASAGAQEAGRAASNEVAGASGQGTWGRGLNHGLTGATIGSFLPVPGGALAGGAIGALGGRYGYKNLGLGTAALGAGGLLAGKHMFGGSSQDQYGAPANRNRVIPGVNNSLLGGGVGLAMGGLLAKQMGMEGAGALPLMMLGAYGGYKGFPELVNKFHDPQGVGANMSPYQQMQSGLGDYRFVPRVPATSMNEYL